MSTPAQHMANLLNVAAEALKAGDNEVFRTTMRAFNNERQNFVELLTDEELEAAVHYIDNEVPVFAMPCGDQDAIVEDRDRMVLELRHRNSVLN